ncbi:hypothetical protein F5883DRAFT_435262 [Diaporthe sp. PMI_573]|nr:hypothetical protein F5883DRAFT_435262 [Diaporthaceae sp. PMI_573]
MIRQPDTRPISREQLVAEVKGIYAGLVIVESKCIEVDSSQSAQNDSNPKLNNEQWQALIALHRTLLHEHHDFFLASHPSASPALRRLASKYFPGSHRSRRKADYHLQATYAVGGLLSLAIHSTLYYPSNSKMPPTSYPHPLLQLWILPVSLTYFL